MRFGSAIKALGQVLPAGVRFPWEAQRRKKPPDRTAPGRDGRRRGPAGRRPPFLLHAQPSTEVKANSPRETLTSQPAHGPSTVPKARMVNAAPVRASPCASGSPSTPEQQMARPVTVQITVVSKKTPVMLISPCRTGLSVSAPGGGHGGGAQALLRWKKHLWRSPSEWRFGG